jgi:aspartyl protease family protein
MTRRRLLLGLAMGALAPAAARADWHRGTNGDIPLSGDGTGWLVDVMVNGVSSGTFLLDTGASFCVLSPSFFRRLRMPRATSHVELQTANGIVRAPLVRLRSLDVGSARAVDLHAVVHVAVAPPLDGVLGLNFLNNFSYAVDPRRRTLRLS